jgi:hypothetical protein
MLYIGLKYKNINGVLRTHTKKILYYETNTNPCSRYIDDNSIGF